MRGFPVLPHLSPLAKIYVVLLNWTSGRTERLKTGSTTGDKDSNEAVQRDTMLVNGPPRTRRFSNVSFFVCPSSCARECSLSRIKRGIKLLNPHET